MNKEVFLQELASVIRTLNFIQEEQTYIKSKLSNFLDNVVDSDVLNWAESLHLEILNRETAVQLLRNDILKIKSQVVQKRFLNNMLDRQIIDSFNKHKQQVVYVETEFVAWKKITNEQFESTL
ncbi:MAG: hypothetical protein RI940_747 [Bacteroidota bacterium]|jgi:hypothetical protein